MNTDSDIIAAVDKAFGGIDRPEHFTNYTHCEECAEHDETLRAKPRVLLTRKDLGTLGWNPVTFCHLGAKAYLFPRLARELLAEPDETYGWYGPEFISLVYWPLGDNDFRQYCNTQQRAVVLALILHVIESRASLVESCCCADDFLSCHQEWSAESI